MDKINTTTTTGNEHWLTKTVSAVWENWWIFIPLVLVIWVIAVYNSLVRKKINMKEAWSGIDVALKRRYELIPNLVETVKGYAKHEVETLEKVLAARSKATSMNIDASKVTPEQMQMFSGMQGEISSGLGKLMAIAEAYPDLKANQNFMQLQNELVDIEDKIQAMRRFYNSTVADYNTALQVFPSSIIGKMFNFTEGTMFELEEDSKAREPVKVQF